MTINPPFGQMPLEGTVEWIPDINYIGTNDFKIKAEASNNRTSETVFSILVTKRQNLPPEIITNSCEKLYELHYGQTQKCFVSINDPEVLSPPAIPTFPSRSWTIAKVLMF